jgi:hypothetical protein
MILNKKERDYRKKVSHMTKINIKHNNINVPDSHEVDHIFPVSYGELLGIPTYVISDINNLQIITREDNLKKSNKCDSIPLFIQQYMLGITKEELDKRSKVRKKLGIEIAKKKGTYKGRKLGSSESKEQFLSKPKIKEVVILLKEGMSCRRISQQLNIHVNTVTKVRKYINGK